MRRRHFIKKAVAGIAISQSGIFTSASLATNDTITLAIIGAGARGRGCIIDTCKVNENVVIKTVCDVNDLKANKAISEIEKALGYKPIHVRNMDIDTGTLACSGHRMGLSGRERRICREKPQHQHLGRPEDG
jgi:NADH/NAD ratio-sensing transcriptional regulator Rex